MPNTEYQNQQKRFLQALSDRVGGGRPCKHWLRVKAGVSGMALSYAIKKSVCTVELYIDLGGVIGAKNSKTKECFDIIWNNRTGIESRFGVGKSLTWKRLDGEKGKKVRRACRIVYEVPGTEFFHKKEKKGWDNIIAKMEKEMGKLRLALAPELRMLNV